MNSGTQSSVPGAFRFCALVLTTLLAGRAPCITLPSKFVEESIGSGWKDVVGLTFSADGRTFVWERGGKVWNVENGVKNATPFLDITEEVAVWNNYGMLGFCLNPNFLNNGYVYVLYTVDRHHLRYFGTSNYDPEETEDHVATIGRITRYTARASDGFRTIDPSSRLVLLGESISNGFPLVAGQHGVGTILFGTDGTLLASCGDSASSSITDIGNGSGTYYQQALSDGIIQPKENVGAYRAQLVDSLNGKVIRIDPITGDGISGNPFYDPTRPRAARSRVWALGLKTPCRMSLRPGTGSHTRSDGKPGVLCIGDVGWNAWEDLNVCDRPGMNFGWPAYEGMEANSPYFSANVRNLDAPNPLYGISGCTQPYFYFTDLIKQDTLNTPSWPNPCNTSQQIPSNIPRFLHARPAMDYKHGSGPARTPTFSGNNASFVTVGASGSPVTGASFGGACIIDGVWYTAGDFPSMYRNTYFAADYEGQWIKNFVFDQNHRPVEVRNFASSAGGVVFMATHPISGALYYVTWTSTVKKIRYVSDGNQPPTAVASLDKNYGPGPLLVQFTGTNSIDPEKLALAYQWNFGDGSALNTNASPVHEFTAPDGVPTRYDVTLRVTDKSGEISETSLIVSVNNTPPAVIITSPAWGSFYSMSGDTLFNCTAVGTDAEHTESQLSCAWQTILHHNNHFHSDPVDTNCATTTTLSPEGCDGQTYFYRVVLVVTDAAGLSATNEVRIYPDCSGIPPEILWANPVDIVYGTALSNAQLNATANVPGSFVYHPAAGKVLSAGNGQVLSAVFMPTDTLTYRTVFSSISINVAPAPLMIAANNISKPYGAPLPALTASYAGLVNGDTSASLDTPVSLTTSAMADSSAGAYPILASGAADANYTITHAGGTLEVIKALPAITWTNPVPILSGTGLNDTQLNALANVPGTFVYDPPAGTTLEPGIGQTLGATFTPDDTLNYAAVTASVMIDVIGLPARPTALAASAASSNQMNLSWRDSSDNEEGFKVERSTNGLDFAQFTIVGPGVTNAADAGLLSATTYYYRVRAFNAAGDSPYSETAQATTVMTLAEAVDAPSLVWKTGGTAPYTAQSAVTHDGLDAAQSGTIGHSQESWLETTVTGPGTLTFWWKVSSELSNDRLRFYVSGSEQFAISGEVDWQFRTVSLSSGAKVLRWRYAKNSSKVAGQDRGWIDQVQFTPPPPPTPPLITSQPVGQNSGEGATVAFNVTASGTTPLTYRWRRDGVNLATGGNISGATTASLTLSSVQATQAGTYSVAVSNVVGGVISTDTLLSVLTRAEAIDAPALLWTSGGSSAPWFAQTSTTHDGADAAQSGATPSSGESWLQTTVTGPGTLNFWWKVSSEANNDLARLYVDGSERLRISGEVDWVPQTFDVPAGNHTLRWRYSKNGSTVLGQDRAWLDQVQFAPPAPVAPLITTQPASRNVNVGATVGFNVIATGTAPLSYHWLSNGVALLNGGNVSGAATPTLTLVNVQATQAANYSVIVSNAVNIATSSDAVLTVSPAPPEPLTLANAVDAPSLSFTGAGNASWVPQNSVTQDGVDAAQSGVIATDQNTRLETRVNGPGTVSFWWKVSSEPVNDQLRFYIGDTEQTRISGEVDWQFRTFNVPSGSDMLLKWRYSKNSSVTAGQDAAWVDQIQFVPGP